MIAAEHGNVRGTPVVLLHGTDIDHRSLQPLEAAFDDTAWRRLYINLPGAPGAPTDGMDSTEAVVAYAEQTVIARLGADAPFALVGHSFGGMLVRALAHRSTLRHRVLGVCLITPVFVAARHQRRLPQHVCLHADEAAVKAVFGDDDAMANEYRAMAVVQHNQGARLFRQFIEPGLRQGDAAVWARIGAHYSLDVEPEAGPPSFDKPSLLLLGRQDTVTGYEDATTDAVLRHYPHATVMLLDEAGHNVHLEHNALCVAAVHDWLERVRRSGA